MKIDKRFLTLKIILAVLFVILIIVDLTMGLNTFLTSSIQELILSSVIGILAVESYQDKTWWFFAFFTVATIFGLLQSIQNMFNFYVSSH